MAFDKLIVKSLTGAAKSGIKMDLAIDSLKEKMVDNISSQIENQFAIQLPFDVRNVLSGEDLPSNLMTPEVINSTPPIPATQKSQVSITINNIENILNQIIQQKNTLQGALNTITSPLLTLETLPKTINPVLNGLDITITTIKALPFPTSVPPGVGIPVSVINGFSDALDTLKILLDKFGGPLEIIPGIIQQINGILVPIVEKFSSFDPIFDKTIKIIAFIKLSLSLPLNGVVYRWDGVRWNTVSRPITPPINSLFGVFGNPNNQIQGNFIGQYYFDGNSNNDSTSQIQQSDIDAVLNQVVSNIQQSLAVTAGPLISNSNNNVNDAANQTLLDQLDINSNNPLFYKGFRLTLEFDPNNTFSFPARRIKGYNPQEGITLYSVPPDQGSGEINTSSTYSFSTSVQVLIEEVQFNIDNYFISKERTNEVSLIISDIKQEIEPQIKELQKEISERYAIFQNYQKRIAEQVKEYGRYDEQLYEDFENEEKYIQKLNTQLKNLQNKLNTDLKYWESQLQLNNLL